MLDLSHIPSQQQTYTFYNVSTDIWQTWNKPRNAKMIEIFCLGGGGGGGQNTVSNPTGAGGGGAAGIVRGIIPAFLLPDTLYILVGKGGIGAITGAAGSVGGISYVGLQPSTSEQTLICKSSTSGAGGGGSNSNSSAATISTIALSAFGNLGLFSAISGLGSPPVSVNGTPGNSATALASSTVTPGAGGAGRNASTSSISGGSILPAPVVLTSTVSGGGTGSIDGASGYGTFQPFCGTGGGGGASVTTGVGGRGGNGWYGCGGGAAGGGTILTKAGDGGDGLVIITVIT
jgi:hypothetical protein